MFALKEKTVLLRLKKGVDRNKDMSRVRRVRERLG